MRTDPGKHTDLDALDPARPVRADPRPRREQDQRRLRLRRHAASDPHVNARSPGLPVNHVVLVDFSGFEDLIDAIGGVTITQPAQDRPSPARSTASTGCSRRATIHLGGRWALGYARIRHTTNPQDSDISRTERQQQVMNAIGAQLVKPSEHLPAADHRPGDRQAAGDRPVRQRACSRWAGSSGAPRRPCSATWAARPQVIGGQDVIVVRPAEHSRSSGCSWATWPRCRRRRAQIYGPGCRSLDRAACTDVDAHGCRAALGLWRGPRAERVEATSSDAA